MSYDDTLIEEAADLVGRFNTLAMETGSARHQELFKRAVRRLIRRLKAWSEAETEEHNRRWRFEL